MAEIILAKIQHRRGRRADLPQPLLPGELGLCIDTGQLFIGLDPADNSMPSKLIIESFPDVTNSTEYANDILDNQLIVITDIPVSDDTYDEYGDVRFIVYRPREEPTTKRIYVGYYTTTSKPLPTPGDNWGYVGVHHHFVDGELDLTQDLAPSTPPVITDYDLDDSGAIADAVNAIYDYDFRYNACNGDPVCISSGQIMSTGLVTVKYNMEILTEYTEISLTGDIIVHPFKQPLFGTDVFADTGIEYDISSEKATDSFKVDYSVTTEGTYSRVGTFTITSSYISGKAMLQDIFVDINDIAPFTLHFQALNTGDGRVKVQYKTEFLSASSSVMLATMTKRWLSF